jgi:CubicO group peptidase (beta-lactamase class C family)
MSFITGIFNAFLSILSAAAIGIISLLGGIHAQAPLVNELPDWVDLAGLRVKYNIVSAIVSGSSETSIVVYYTGAGRVVYEEYRHGFTPEHMHPLNSATKSFLSTMIGMLIHDGYIEGVDQKVIDFFPEAVDMIPAGQESKLDMTLRHILVMRAGLPWLAQHGSLDFMLCEEDSGLAAFLAPQIHPPGYTWIYCGGPAMQVLVAVIERATGRYFHELIQERIFDPMGMEHAEWRIFTADGRAMGASGLYMTARDMVRYGMIYLYDGVINGQRVLPEGWVEETLFNNEEYQVVFGLLPYNNLWWGNNYSESAGRSARAQGFAGMLVSVYPDSGLVVARTGGRSRLLGDGTGAWPLILDLATGRFLYLFRLPAGLR